MYVFAVLVTKETPTVVEKMFEKARDRTPACTSDASLNGSGTLETVSANIAQGPGSGLATGPRKALA